MNGHWGICGRFRVRSSCSMDSADNLETHTWGDLIEIISDRILPYTFVGSFSLNKLQPLSKSLPLSVLFWFSLTSHKDTFWGRSWKLDCPGCFVTSPADYHIHFPLQHSCGKMIQLRKIKYSPSATKSGWKNGTTDYWKHQCKAFIREGNVLTWYSELARLHWHCWHTVTLLTHPFSKWSASFLLITTCPQPVWQGIKAYSHKLWCSWELKKLESNIQSADSHLSMNSLCSGSPGLWSAFLLSLGKVPLHKVIEITGEKFTYFTVWGFFVVVNY